MFSDDRDHPDRDILNKGNTRMSNPNSTSSGSGAFSSLSNTKNAQYSVMPEQLVSQLKNHGGADFIVIQRDRQSNEPKIWSTGDRDQTYNTLNLVSQLTSQPETTT